MRKKIKINSRLIEGRFPYEEGSEYFCPCGKKIEIKNYHRYTGVPKVCKSGHTGLVKENRKKNSRLQEGYRLYEEGKQYFCICGCNQGILFKKRYRYTGVPRYINGHNPTILSDEGRKKLSLQRKPRTEKEKKAISTGTRLAMQNLEVRKKISDSRKGKGHKHTEETKRILSKNNIGELNPFYGKNHFKEQKQMWSKQRSGSNNPNWQDGKSFEPYGLDFNRKLKKQIRVLYNFKCVECNYDEKELGYKLHIHHIDYNKKNNDILNLIPLCRPCHAQTNFNRNDWKTYYSQKV